MRITALTIDGFGIFHDLPLDNLPPGLVLVRGDNEAGKSTLLGFIRCIFFGFPRKNAGEPDFPPLEGGRHGGRIGVILGNGDSYGIERSPGRGGGLVSVTLPGGGIGGEAELARLLGGATRELYKKIYAFGLAELQTFETLKAEHIQSAIYGASAGTAILSLPQAMDTLQKGLGKLFKPGGSKLLINARLGEIESIRERLRQARGGIEAYDQACGSLRQVEQDLGILMEETAQLKAEQEKATACLRVWPDWIELQQCERKLADLPAIEHFPENGLQKLDTELATLAGLEEQIDRLERQYQGLADELESLVIDENLLRHAEAIELLIEERSRYLGARQALPIQMHERQELEETIGHLLEALGKDWAEQRVLAMDRSLFTREEIRTWQETLEKAESELKQSAGLLADRQHTMEKALGDEKAAEEKFTEFGDLDLEADPAVLNELKERRAQFVFVIPDLPQVEQQLKETQAHVANLIREIHPQWTPEDLARFDGSLAAQQRIETFDTERVKQRELLATAHSDLPAAERALAETRRKEEAMERCLNEWPAPASDSREGLVERCRTLRSLRGAITAREKVALEAEHCRRRLQDKQQESSRLDAPPPRKPDAAPIRFLTLLALVMIMTGGLIGLFGSRTVGVAMAVVGAATVLWAIMEARSRRIRAEQRAREAEAHRSVAMVLSGAISALETQHARLLEEEAELTRKMTALAARPGISLSSRQEELEELEDRTHEEIQAFDRRRQLEGDLDELRRETARAEEEHSRATRTVKDREEAMKALTSQWEAHLTGLGLSSDITPRTAALVASRVDAARKQLKIAEDLRDRIGRMREARDQYRSLAGKIPSLASVYDGPALSPAEGSDSELLARVDALFERLRQIDEERRQRELALRILEEKREQVRLAQEALDLQEKTHGEALARLEKDRQQWQVWLRRHGLAEELSPRTVLEAFGQIERCVAQIDRREALREKIKGQQESLEQYVRSVVEIFHALGQPGPDPESIPLGVAELSRKLKEDQKRQVVREEKEGQLRDLEQNRSVLSRDAEASHQRIQALLGAAGTEEEREFRERGRIFNQHEQLADRVGDLRLTILKVTGEVDEAAIRSLLSATSDEELRLKAQTLGQEIEESEQTREDLRKRRAELKHQIESMRTADDVARLRGEEECLLAEIRSQAVTWARQAVALHLLQKARERFEKDQQPQVIREAAGYFSRITGGRYSGLLARVGVDKLEVITPLGARKTPEVLSRGTAEQLYLAIRFGYIRHRARDSESLPVVMDDILVNFDATRAAYAIEMT
ncbi:MAG: AAA family ATPase, partial [Chloroflexi bacterium]|nr:AAA family ATPase [Chloroflexota bacterium]